MASTEQLRSGRYRPIARDSAGHKIPGLGTFRLKSEAQHAADEAEVLARRRAPTSTLALPASTTWGEWWDILSLDRVFESDTNANERSIVTKHIRPRWGTAGLNEIRRGEINKWIKHLSKQRTPAGKLYEPSYVCLIYNVFRTSINAAINHDPPVLLVSPLVQIELPPIRKKAKQFVPMDEVPVLTKQLRDDYADIVAFELETGLRPGELAGLHDDQIDVQGRLLTVTNVYVQQARKIRGWPKDDDSRTIPLSPAALAIYLRRVEGRDMNRPCGIPHYRGKCTGDLVFRTSRGSVIGKEILRGAMTRAADRAGLAGRSGYALRRGFATRVARGGIDLFELMDIMGWSDPKLAREYIQQSVGTRDRLLTALGDPDATKLRIVGQQDGRGTERGTESAQEGTNVTGRTRRRKTS